MIDDEQGGFSAGRGCVDQIFLFQWEEVMFNKYMYECASSRSVGSPRKRWIDTIGVLKEKRFGCQVRKENGPG